VVSRVVVGGLPTDVATEAALPRMTLVRPCIDLCLERGYQVGAAFSNTYCFFRIPHWALFGTTNQHSGVLYWIDLLSSCHSLLLITYCLFLARYRCVPTVFLGRANKSCQIVPRGRG